MAFERSSGLLLHISSLPSRGGIGDLGPAAYDFADFLAASKQRLWQVLPLNPTGYGNSPYASLSAFAANPFLISLERLVEAGWIGHDRLNGLPGTDGNVKFEDVERLKKPLLEEAARNFLDRDDPRHNARRDPEQWNRFQAFCQRNSTWLNDYAAYAVLREKYHSGSWQSWPREFAYRHADALRELEAQHGRELEVEKAIQFAFDEQWGALRTYCAERGIRFIGDVAIFVNYDSADVWTHPEIFDLREDLSPVRIAGVPPDYFSATGQRWGNPLYRWDVLEKRGFDWWVDRIRRSLDLYDVMRLDHFRGFEAYWAIPAEHETAEHGTWVKAPGDQLFAVLGAQLGILPFIAEDLGLITVEVNALREKFDLPGMRVLQFGFGGPGPHIYLPHSYEKNTVVYSGTHDNDTTAGWWRHGATEEEKRAVRAYLNPSEGDVVWSLIRAAETSVADICLLPVQDLLGLGSEARMNTPAKPEDNWAWRLAPGALTADLAKRLGDLTELTDRHHAE